MKANILKTNIYNNEKYIYLQNFLSFVTFNDLEVKIFKDIQQSGKFFKSNYIKKDMYINLI